MDKIRRQTSHDEWFALSSTCKLLLSFWNVVFEMHYNNFYYSYYCCCCCGYLNSKNCFHACFSLQRAYLFFSLSFSLFLKCLRKILPLAFFGIFSIISTPPLSFFCGATFAATKASICSGLMSPLGTTNAFGNSPAFSSGIPMTAASSMFGWEISNASSSAGATCEEDEIR